MTECDEVAEGMLKGFISWLTLEGRDMSQYSASRFVCNALPDESPNLRGYIARSLYDTARREAGDALMRDRLEEMGPMAGSW